MALEDKDIFKAICDRYAGQSIEFIMLQYEKARQINREIEKRELAEMEPVAPKTEEIPEAANENAEPPKKKISRRSLKVKPQDSITHEQIYCCVCGEEHQSITAKHLAKHDLTAEEYKKLCGFPDTQPLMSGKRLEQSKQIIARAQQARIRKKELENRD